MFPTLASPVNPFPLAAMLIDIIYYYPLKRKLPTYLFHVSDNFISLVSSMPMEDEGDNITSLLTQYFAYVNSSNLVIQSAINALSAQENRLYTLLSRIVPERNVTRRHDVDYVFSPPPQRATRGPFSMRPSPVVTETFGFGTPMSPVTVAPTDNQIVAATTVFLFSEVEDPVNSVCPITQERFNPTDLVMRINHCGHLFKASAIRQWFIRNVHCPLCR